MYRSGATPLLRLNVAALVSFLDIALFALRLVDLCRLADYCGFKVATTLLGTKSRGDSDAKSDDGSHDAYLVVSSSALPLCGLETDPL